MKIIYRGEEAEIRLAKEGEERHFYAKFVNPAEPASVQVRTDWLPEYEAYRFVDENSKLFITLTNNASKPHLPCYANMVNNKCVQCVSYDMWCGICLNPASESFKSDEENIAENEACELFNMEESFKVANNE